MYVTKKSITTVTLMSLLVISGFSLPLVANATSGNPTSITTQTPTILSQTSLQKIFSGPFRTTPSVVSKLTLSTNIQVPKDFPEHNDKPSAGLQPLVASIPPVVNCTPLGPGCDTISTVHTASSIQGLNIVDQSGSYPTIGAIEPPDQGLCAGNGFVVEIVNLGVLRVHNSGLNQLSGDITLDNLMGLASRPSALGGLGWSSGGDIQCLYDPSNGGHWFITEFVATNSESQGGALPGTFQCFFGVYPDACREGLAVSVTNNPLGSYNVYFIDPNFVHPSDPGFPFLLNDYAKTATTRDAFLLFYDEFPTTIAGFNGAQELAITKNGLENGFSPVSGFLNAVVVNMGKIPTPDQVGPCSPICSPAWYQVIPAQTPDSAQFDISHGGTGYMAAVMDFFGTGDSRVAVFAWTDLTDLNSYACSECGSIAFTGQLFKGVDTYVAGGQAAQKAGPTPLGDNCATFGLAGSQPCPEGGIQSNGDGATQASFSGGHIWFATSTVVTQKYAKAASENHIGAAFWSVGTGSFDKTGFFSLTSQGYVSPAHEDIEFPSFAAIDSASALVSFTLSGNGGPTHADHGGFFPSSAFGWVTTTSGGLVSSTVNIAALGQAPQDGFTEYSPPARWGDYGAAVFVPSSPGSGEGTVFFSSEYIQHHACTDAEFLVDPSCGSTRDPFANWGTSINSIGT